MISAKRASRKRSRHAAARQGDRRVWSRSPASRASLAPSQGAGNISHPAAPRATHDRRFGGRPGNRKVDAGTRAEPIGRGRLHHSRCRAAGQPRAAASAAGARGANEGSSGRRSGSAMARAAAASGSPDRTSGRHPVRHPRSSNFDGRTGRKGRHASPSHQDGHILAEMRRSHVYLETRCRYISKISPALSYFRAGPEGPSKSELVRQLTRCS